MYVDNCMSSHCIRHPYKYAESNTMNPLAARSSISVALATCQSNHSGCCSAQSGVNLCSFQRTSASGREKWKLVGSQLPQEFGRFWILLRLRGWRVSVAWTKLHLQHGNGAGNFWEESIVTWVRTPSLLVTPMLRESPDALQHLHAFTVSARTE